MDYEDYINEYEYFLYVSEYDEQYPFNETDYGDY